MNKVYALLLIAALLLCSLSGVSANSLHYDGTKKLSSHIYISTTYIDPNGVQKTKYILDKYCDVCHNAHRREIPNEAKFNDIIVDQRVFGVPHDCKIVLLNYEGGDIDVDYSISNAWVKDGGRLKVNYEGKDALANSDNNYIGYWSRT